VLLYDDDSDVATFMYLGQGSDAIGGVWVGEGLLKPTDAVSGTYYFDFKQMSAAQTLRELADAGASLKKLRGG
jgi:hypothetical protein